MYKGTRDDGTIHARMVYTPVDIPAPPAPWTALPAIKPLEFGATPAMLLSDAAGTKLRVTGHAPLPQTRLPNSKTKMAANNVHFLLRYFNALPQKLTNAARVTPKAEPYQPT